MRWLQLKQIFMPLLKKVTVDQGLRPPSKKQTLLSPAILLVLTGIGSGIILKHHQYNPAVLALRPGEIGAADRGQTPANRLNDSVFKVPANMVPLTPAEVFNPQNLSDKINGKAELYLAADFRLLRSQRFAEKGNPDSWLEVFVYDMQNNRNAFSVFSTQQREDSEPMDIAEFSYRSKNALYLVHGPYYLEIVASTDSERISQSLVSIAENFIRDTIVEGKSINELDLFPKQNLDWARELAVMLNNRLQEEGADREP
jgi:hypothetical protein